MRGSLKTLSLLALAAGCIPSHRIVHDGDRYFEHCYGADFDRRVTPAQNEACWQAWLAHYSRYQPAQRLDYAMRRVEALEAGEAALKLPGLNSGVQREVTPEHQSLLETAQSGAPPKLAAISADAAVPAIPNGCLATCDSYEAHCSGECPEGNVECRHGCTRERAICLGGCH
jgi:hypothetical protein